MLAHVIRKEILHTLTSPRFVLLGCLGALTVLLSLASGYRYYAERLGDFGQAQSASQERLRQMQRRRDWDEMGNIGVHVHKPPNPMSVFVRGMDGGLGRSVQVASKQGRATSSPAAANPILGFFPPLDLALVVGTVFGLLVLFVTCDAVCGEKETGTLALCGSYPVSRATLMIGKLVGGLVPVYAVLAAAVLLGTGLVLLLPQFDASAVAWGRLGWLGLAFAIYLLCFGCAGLLASSLTYRAATAFVLLLAFWVASVAVVPPLSLLIADQVRPTMSRQEYRARRAVIAREMATVNRQRRWEWRDTHADYWKRTPESLEAYWAFYGRMKKEVLADFQPRFDALESEFENGYARRRGLAVSLARLSPAFALKSTAFLLTGSGPRRQQRFLESAAAYGEAERGWWWDFVGTDRLRMFHKEIYGERDWSFEGMPRYAYAERWVGADVADAFLDVGLLGVWSVLFFAAAFVAVLRYDVRP